MTLPFTRCLRTAAGAGVYPLRSPHKGPASIAKNCTNLSFVSINLASKVCVVRRPAAAVIVLALSAASLVLDQTAYHPVDTLHAKDHGSPVHRLGCHRHHVHLGSPVLDRDSHPLRDAAAGRGSGLGSLSQTTGEEGTDWVLDLVGLGESPLVVRAHRRCRCFAVGVYKPGCSEGAEDSCFAKGCRKCVTVLIAADIDYRMEVDLVVGMEDHAGRRPVSVCVGWSMRSKENLGRTGLVARSCFEGNGIAQLPN